MRVSIEHKEKTTGIFSKKTWYIVSLKVEFSQEERTIIEKRKLSDYVIWERPHDDEAQERHKKDLAFLDSLGPDNLTAGKLAKGKPDEYALATPIGAKNYESKLKDALVGMKDFIAGNAEIEQKSTSFEL